jgi:hypothetical protein
LSSPIDFEAALDAYIRSIEEERTPDGNWHPSNMWTCARQAVLSMRGAEQTQPPDAVSLRRFRIGHMFHELAQAALWKIKGVKNVIVEFPVRIPGFRVAGHGDALVVLEDGGAWVIEFKSTKTAGLKKGLQPQHGQQGKTYAVIVRKYGIPDREVPPLGDMLKGVVVVYITKDDGLTVEHVMEYDDSWEAELMERIEYLEQYRQDPESLPPCITQDRSGKWMENYCPFFPTCREREREPRLIDIEHW